METERRVAPTLPPRQLPASPSTVGELLTKASAAGAVARECPTPRSLLSRILRRGGGGGGGGFGFGCRLRLPRYCASGAAKEDAAEYAAPNVVASQAEVSEPPRSSVGKKAAAEVSPASLGLGASLVFLLSRSAAELNRMEELRTHMERLVLGVKGEVRSTTRSSASDDHTTDSSSVVVKEPIAGGENGALSRCSRTAAPPSGGENAGHHAAVAMDQMEAELEVELTRLQFAVSSNGECATPRRDQHLEKRDDHDSTKSHSATCTDDVMDGDGDDDEDILTDQCGDEEQGNGEESEAGEETSPPPHGGVPARELERRLHELLQSQHEERIAELETALERAQRKLQEKEREVYWWRNTAKLVTRHKDDSRLR
ncbi:hypothetical protein GUJ93_ZPchr0006g45895 [Zizania palustris]|uniref:Protein POLAR LOCALIZATION DURING ASYMMETRIC DIVISION AND REDISTRIBUTION n=1 Tax=Zizania palustris TaxID=103762 RepID=A0A8J5VIW3_ZIZPA|nr:hypothetical protein GUJ93_ZPchr0006g45895 [Zizania palustris]